MDPCHPVLSTLRTRLGAELDLVAGQAHERRGLELAAILVGGVNCRVNEGDQSRGVVLGDAAQLPFVIAQAADVEYVLDCPNGKGLRLGERRGIRVNRPQGGVPGGCGWLWRLAEPGAGVASFTGFGAGRGTRQPRPAGAMPWT